MKIKLCQCGKAIPRKTTPNGSSTWNKYCSDECIKIYSKKNKVKPVYCPCGKEAVHKRTPKGKYKWNKYCSDICRKAYYFRTIKPKICACGKNIAFKLKPDGYPYWNKFCSDECRSLYGSYPKGKTKSAICIGCGLEFTRPDSYTSAMKYCSNKCSHSEQKRVRDKYVMTTNEDAVIFRSGWELRFVAACLRYNIPWRRYDGELIITSVGNYRPDFIVDENENIIEIKGRLDQDSIVKIKTAHQIFGDKYYVLLEEELVHFEETGQITNSLAKSL